MSAALQLPADYFAQRCSAVGRFGECEFYPAEHKRNGAGELIHGVCVDAHYDGDGKLEEAYFDTWTDAQAAREATEQAALHAYWNSPAYRVRRFVARVLDFVLGPDPTEVPF